MEILTGNFWADWGLLILAALVWVVAVDAVAVSIIRLWRALMLQRVRKATRGRVESMFNLSASDAAE